MEIWLLKTTLKFRWSNVNTFALCNLYKRPTVILIDWSLIDRWPKSELSLKRHKYYTAYHISFMQSLVLLVAFFISIWKTINRFKLGYSWLLFRDLSWLIFICMSLGKIKRNSCKKLVFYRYSIFQIKMKESHELQNEFISVASTACNTQNSKTNRQNFKQNWETNGKSYVYETQIDRFVIL